jgi:hypothetical protein
MGAIFAAWLGVAQAVAADADSGLYTTYTATPESLSYHVCGTVGTATGCFADGELSLFKRACALVEGKPNTSGNVITRALYVLDKRTNTKPLTLHVFKRTDTFSENSVSVSITHTSKVPLGIPGGPGVKCFLVASDNYVFAADSAVTGGPTVVSINKTNLGVSTRAFGHVVSLSADDRGFVAMTTTTIPGGVATSGVLHPNGVDGFGGGGAAGVAGTRNALMQWFHEEGLHRSTSSRPTKTRVNETASLDADLIAWYELGEPSTVVVSFCGAVGNSSGCYGGGQPGGFESLCAIIDSVPMTRKNVMTRNTFFFDRRSDPEAPVRLQIFKRTDEFEPSFVRPRIEHKKRLSLAIPGGPDAGCLMAGNAKFVFAGTTSSGDVGMVDRETLGVTAIAGSKGRLRAITADDFGYVVTRFEQGAEIRDPTGALLGAVDGDLANQRTGLIFH